MAEPFQTITAKLPGSKRSRAQIEGLKLRRQMVAAEEKDDCVSLSFILGSESA